MKGVVLAFGSFDPIHEGHINFFKQARKLGDSLLVVVARDSSIQALKGRQPFQDEAVRLEAVKTCGVVDEAVLGETKPGSYDLLSQLDFNVLALGYDQKPSDKEVIEELERRGKGDVSVVRLTSFKPDQFKSSHLRS